MRFCYSDVMKKIVTLLIILAALICLLILILTFTNVRTPFSAASPESFSMTTAQIHENTDTYAVNAQYPQFGIPSIDTQIQKTVEAAADDIRSAPANPPDSAVTQNTLDGSFDKVYAGPDVISIELILSEYTGGAHPNTAFAGMSFDRATGKELTLDDALRLTGLTLEQVAAQSSVQLQQQLGSGFQFQDGAAPTADNYGQFLVDQKNVTFIFGEYQVAAYSAGVQYVSFPRKQ
jgi:hypothetical protein